MSSISQLEIDIPVKEEETDTSPKVVIEDDIVVKNEEGEDSEVDEDIIEEVEEEDSEDDEDEDFKKFEQGIKKDLLIDFHPQMKQISHKEMLTLCKIIRDKKGNIIDPLHKTIPFLTKFEKAKIIGLRAKQINNGSDPFIEIPNNMIEGLTIAEKELEEKKVPFIIRRPLPNGASEYWKVNDLEML